MAGYLTYKSKTTMTTHIIREITPIADDDFFVIMSHENAKFDFPVHYHPEFELNLVLNAEGKRIVGDSILPYTTPDLVLIGSNTPHAWQGNSPNAHVVTIQFHANIISEIFLSRKLAFPIKELFEQAQLGIAFSEETINKVKDKILNLPHIHGFESVLILLSILNELSISKDKTLLSNSSYVQEFGITKSRRIKIVDKYISKNINSPLKINDVAELVNMSQSAFSHFFKKRTQCSFTDYVTRKRIGIAAKLLITTEKTISEICFDCGFNNVSNFNRSFRIQKGCTPSEFRAQQKLVTEYNIQ